MIIIFMGFVVLGLVALQNYLYYKWWNKGLTLDIKFSAKEAFEGETLFIQEELSNRKFLPLPWVFAKFQLSRNLKFEGATRNSDAHYQNDLFSVMMYQSIKRKISFVCSKRGFYRLRNINLICSNLLHTKRFSCDIQCFSELTVFPKLLEEHDKLDVLFKSLDATLLSNSLINPDPFEFKGIREYQPTDPLKDVNFKASAVAQQLMVNIHAPTSSKRLEIILNLEYYSSFPNLELYEQAIRFAATAAEKFVSENVKVGFNTNGKDLSTGENICIHGGGTAAHLYSVFQALARIDTTLKVKSIVPFLENIQDDSAVYLIISSYHEKDFIAAIEDMETRGISYMVVLPVQKGMRIDMAESEKVKIWEAL